MQASAAGHPGRDGFPHDSSERAQKIQRQEIVAHIEISQQYKKSRTHLGIQRHRDGKMVGGCSIRGALCHEDPHGRDDDIGARRPVLRLKQPKNEHKELN